MKGAYKVSFRYVSRCKLCRLGGLSTLELSSIKQRYNQRAQQAYEKIHGGICHTTYHVGFENVIVYIFVKFPEDHGCPGAGECKDDLHRKGNLSDKLLRVPDRDAIKIRDHKAAEEMRRDIQWRE